MLSKIKQKLFLRQFLVIFFAVSVFLTSCGDRSDQSASDFLSSSVQGAKRASRVTEVSPPAMLQALSTGLDRYRPQVKILSPRAGDVLEADQVSVKLQVKDLPIFKDAELGMGLHLDLVLDNHPSRSIYDLSEPIVLKNLEPGTHTLRVFASRPWHETFKNDGAFAQISFSLFTPTQQNNPDPSQPLLTYNAPAGQFGAEPILVDFYLSNASGMKDWRIRCTVNGQSFVLDRWQPLYLKGFQPGKNWVRLELIDAQGKPVANAFNDVVQVIDYQPGGSDTLSRLVRGDLNLEQAKAIVIEGYKPPEIPQPVVPEMPETKPSLVPLVPSSTPSATTTPSVLPSPQGTSTPLVRQRLRPIPTATSSTTVVKEPQGIKTPTPVPTFTPVAKVEGSALSETTATKATLSPATTEGKEASLETVPAEIAPEKIPESNEKTGFSLPMKGAWNKFLPRRSGKLPAIADEQPVINAQPQPTATPSMNSTTVKAADSPSQSASKGEISPNAPLATPAPSPEASSPPVVNSGVSRTVVRRRRTVEPTPSPTAEASPSMEPAANAST